MSEAKAKLRNAARLAAGWALLMAATVPARGQCLLVDNLDGGACWTTATPALPVFPALTTGVRGLCWLDCALEDDRTESLEISKPRKARDPNRAPSPIASYYVARFTVRDGAGTQLWSGVMRMAYSRTWYEVSESADYQVWRFLVNGDLRATAAAGSAPCPVPPCAASFNNKAHFTGYVDYAQDCFTGTFTCAGAITHELDQVDHASGFSRAGVFHPDRNYDFVWPAAGFVPETNETFTDGSFATGSLRPLDWSVLPASSQIETYEDKFSIGALTHFADTTCAGDPSGPASTYRMYFSGRTDLCGIRASGNPADERTLECRAIGGWTDPSRFPGQESVLLMNGVLRMSDPCRPRTRDEFFRGVMTRGGFPAQDITRDGLGGAFWPNMFDLGNELGLPPAMANSRNVKFISDLIINASSFL